jgi:formate dehydrogenase major subunit
MEQEKKQGRFELSRRDFLKVSAAGAAAATMVDWAPAPAMAIDLHGTDTATNTFHTTCPYCSASCGQVVVVGNNTGDVYDIHGDWESPFSNGGLCVKGAGAYQLVTNKRRLGAYDTNPVNPTFAYDPAYTEGIAYKRVGNEPWTKMDLQEALEEAAGRLKGHRDTAGFSSTGPEQFDSKGVVFFGSSHLNNEQNYVYRKLVANFGTTDTEHQARI